MKTIKNDERFAPKKTGKEISKKTNSLCFLFLGASERGRDNRVNKNIELERQFKISVKITKRLQFKYTIKAKWYQTIAGMSNLLKFSDFGPDSGGRMKVSKFNLDLLENLSLSCIFLSF
jgi:hypothetical protein